MSLALTTDSDKARFAEKYQVAANGCWQWTAALDRSGYGRFGVSGATRSERRMRLAHRVSYETHVSPIPEGLDLDHLCGNRACVNPEHLEPVPHVENMRRTRQDRCARGHVYDEETTYTYSNGRRSCRACRREWWHERRKGVA